MSNDRHVAIAGRIPGIQIQIEHFAFVAFDREVGGNLRLQKLVAGEKIPCDKTALEAMRIAAELCVFTNDSIVLETLSVLPPSK